MTDQKLLETISSYKKLFQEYNITAKRFNHESISTTMEAKLSHCCYMIDKIEGFVAINRIQKAHRWLGFIQGVLWSEKFFSLSKMRRDNRG